jgi:hypothetical protein
MSVYYQNTDGTASKVRKNMTQYLIYRHGSNAANQSMCGKLPIDIIEAASKGEAIRIAGENHTCYANQFFSAVCESRAKHDDWCCVCEEKAMHARDQECEDAMNLEHADAMSQ